MILWIKKYRELEEFNCEFICFNLEKMNYGNEIWYYVKNEKLCLKCGELCVKDYLKFKGLIKVLFETLGLIGSFGSD